MQWGVGESMELKVTVGVGPTSISGIPFEQQPIVTIYDDNGVMDTTFVGSV